MVVHPSFPGVDVMVAIEGKEAKELKDDTLEEDSERTITRYIEAVDGLPFSVKFKVDRSAEFKGDCYNCHIFLDKKLVSGPIMCKSSVQKGKMYFECDGDIAAGQKWPFRFSGLETTSSHGYGLAADLAQVKDLGRISVKLFHSKLGKSLGTSATISTPTLGRSRIVSEKAMKGRSIALCADFGMPTQSRDIRIRSTTPVGHKNYDIRYVFEYRSRDALKAMCLVPRTPSPEPFESADFSHLSRDQILARIAEFQATARTEQRVKRELADEEHHTHKRARREATLSQRVGQQAVVLEINDDGTLKESVQQSKEGDSAQEIVELD
ncbi:hypothetical protein K431DRAFT_312528 [Polychaeton citri CBS 116435]|uniref:DUF7918 domain-containing protein n=1 Tax=Polychaeton citri CBS 116435 TaxID=1314669 RepID=A0A9P4QAM3_9PEZI|nr:hypothetical protein K431DRAFT_312528 [Polychaeton citri CBS 116435]